MDKKHIFFILMIGLAISILFISNDIYSDEKREYEKIDTGFTPEQIWDIINGEDIGVVIINGDNVNGEE